MTNIRISTEDSGSGSRLLVLKIDLAQSAGPSKSGKCELVATTSGWERLHELDPGLSLSLNLIHKQPRGQSLRAWFKEAGR